MSHTPGPWEVERRTGQPDHWQVNGVNDDPGFQWRGLAMIYTSGSWADDPEGLANAHLIAAAPDMLEALEDMLRANWPDGIDAARSQAAEVVRKARGEK